MLEDLVRSDRFQGGLVAGAVALALVLATAVAIRRSGRAGLPGLAGVALVVASLVELDRFGDSVLDDQLVGGLLVLAVGAFVTRWLRWPVLIGVLAAVPGAALVATSTDVADIDIPWVRALTFLTIVVGAALVPEFDRENARGGLGPVLFAVTALGMYTTLPDTEEVLVVIGVTWPLALLGWPKPWASLGAAGSAATVGLVAWIASVGGQGRPGAIIGALACLGVMLIEPVVLLVFGRRRPPTPTSPFSSGVIVVAALHVALVMFVSLAAGREISARAAAAISAVGFAGATLALLVILGLRRPETTARDRNA
jgi:hypothetical protein